MAIAVTNDASAFKRSANVPTQTAFSLWGWFYFTSVTPARFWGPLGIYAGTDGNPTGGTAYLQVSSASSGSSQLVLAGGTISNVNLVNASANTWYFIALTCSGNSTGQVIAYARALTANTLTSAPSTGPNTAFTSARIEWGREAFTGDFISGRIHACGAANVALSADELLELSYFHEPQLDGIRSLNVFYPTINAVNTDCTTDMSGNARNATATVGALADSPPLLWKAIAPPWNLPAATASGALTGSTTVTFSQSGTLTGDGALSGSSTLAFSQSGTISGNAPITGASTITFSQAGSLVGAGALAGTSTVTFSQSGSLSGAGALSGSTTLTFSPTATLTGNGALTGTATVTFNVTGTLTSGAGSIAGTSSIAFTAVGVLKGTGALSGSTTLTFSQVGVLDTGNAVLETIPYLIGAEEYSARIMLGSIYMNVTVVGSGGTVTAQSIEPFSFAPRGTSVEITIGGAIYVPPKGTGNLPYNLR
jgi:hypothetical protein